MISVSPKSGDESILVVVCAPILSFLSIRTVFSHCFEQYKAATEPADPAPTTNTSHLVSCISLVVQWSARHKKICVCLAAEFHDAGCNIDIGL